MHFFVTFIYYVCQILSFAIVVRAILSWFPGASDNVLGAMVFQLTEPLISPLRRIIPRAGIFDLTPLVAIVILQIISRVILSLAV